MDWDRLKMFYNVAEAGSFTNAAKRLNLSQSAISRQVLALEDSIDQTLFHRHARGLILTENGELLHQTVKDVFHQLEMVKARLSESKDTPYGTLRITTTTAFGATWLTDRMRGFLESYPDVTVSLTLSDVELDLGMREADCAIRMAPPQQVGLIQKKLNTFRLKIYASTDYLERMGTPTKPEDLDNFQLILYDMQSPAPMEGLNWLQTIGGCEEAPRRPALSVNSLTGIYRAVRSGLGIASLPDYMARDPGALGLKQILPDVVGPQTQSYFVYPEELRHSKRISVFRDYLIDQVDAFVKTADRF